MKNLVSVNIPADTESGMERAFVFKHPAGEQRELTIRTSWESHQDAEVLGPNCLYWSGQADDAYTRQVANLDADTGTAQLVQKEGQLQCLETWLEKVAKPSGNENDDDDDDKDDEYMEEMDASSDAQLEGVAAESAKQGLARSGSGVFGTSSASSKHKTSPKEGKKTAAPSSPRSAAMEMMKDGKSVAASELSKTGADGGSALEWGWVK